MINTIPAPTGAVAAEGWQQVNAEVCRFSARQLADGSVQPESYT